MGTPDFAIPILRAIYDSHHDLIAVITRPDKPFGRDKVITPPPVALVAKELGVSILQPEKLKGVNFLQTIKELNPDYLVVAAYGKIIPESVLAIPKKASINIHPSLIPKYRGAAPIQWTLINGDTETGVTLMDITKELDAGEVYLQKKMPVDPKDTTGSLSEKLSAISSELIVECLNLFEEGKIKPTKQDPKQVVMAPPLTHEDGHLDWSSPAPSIFNRFRGVTPKPGAYTNLEEKVLKIHKMDLDDSDFPSGNHPPGTIVNIKGDHFKVDTGGGIIKITELQLEGKRRMSTSEFLRGHKLEVGLKLGL